MAEPSPVAPGFTVLGGRGPSMAEIEDLTSGARALQIAADHLADAGAALRRAQVGAEAALFGGRPEARGPYQQLRALVDGTGGSTALHDELVTLARGLTRAATAYVDAESTVQRSVRVLASGVGWWIGEHPLPAAAMALTGGLAVGSVALVGASSTGLIREAAAGGGPLTTVLGLAAQRGSALFTEVGGTQAVVALFASAARSLPPGTQVPTLKPVPSAAGGLLGVLPPPGTASLATRADPP
ncbi:hypothetical protein [Cellulomonas soli]